MTKRPKPRRSASYSVWNRGTFVNVLSIPILTVAFYFIGNYFLTGDELKRHETEIAQNQKSIVAEAQARDANRNEYLDKLSKLNDGIAQLNTQAAVAKVSQDTMNTQLGKIVDELHSINGRR